MSISEAQITSLGIWTTSPCNYLVSESGLLHLPGTNILVEIGKCFQKELGFFRSNFRETYRFSSYFTFIVSAWPRRFYDLRRFNAEFVQLEASERIFLVKIKWWTFFMQFVLSRSRMSFYHIYLFFWIWNKNVDISVKTTRANIRLVWLFNDSGYLVICNCFNHEWLVCIPLTHTIKLKYCRINLKMYYDVQFPWSHTYIFILHIVI